MQSRPFPPLSRRGALKLGLAAPWVLSWASLGLAPEAAADAAHLRVRDQVPDPENLFLTVQYPGKAPLRLAGHYWYNAATVAAGERCPAIVEFLPYRRRDGTMYTDAKMYPWYAAQGYLCFRIDLQGSGDSEGVLEDEYTDEELAYCIQVINQIAAHPRCDGKVGMMGKSWGAINSLMVAARKDRPAALKAVLVCCGSDDRYSDDVHYMNGAMMFDNFSWPSSMWGWMSQPPDPAIVGDRWQAMWRERIEQSDFWFRQWGTHQTRDDYWSRTAVRDRYADVGVPVFILSGWQDGYKNPVEHMVSGLAALGKPVSGLLGPWGHKYPFNAAPGPDLPWLQYSLTHFWDRWLKDRTPDPAAEWPQLPVWLSASREPSVSTCGDETGRWVSEDHAWKSRTRDEFLYLATGHALAAWPGAEHYEVGSARITGTTMLETSSWGECGNDDLPGDEGADDRHPTGHHGRKQKEHGPPSRLQFDGQPLAADLDVFGYPTAELTLSADQVTGSIAVRLSEVSPDTGAAHLVTYAFCNLAYRNGDLAHPEHLTPGEKFRVHVPMNLTGHTFRKGWKLRLSISPGYFPTLWANPAPLTVTVYAGESGGLPASRLRLPTRTARAEDARMPALLPATNAPGYVDPEDYVPLKEARPARTTRVADTVRLHGKRGARISKVFDSGRYQYGGPLDGLWVDQWADEHYETVEGEPLSMTATSTSRTTLERTSIGWRAESETSTRLWSELAPNGECQFHFTATVRAYAGPRRPGDAPFAEKTVSGTIRRDPV